jgi:hypothetical protein
MAVKQMPYFIITKDKSIERNKHDKHVPVTATNETNSGVSAILDTVLTFGAISTTE